MMLARPAGALAACTPLPDHNSIPRPTTAEQREIMRQLQAIAQSTEDIKQSLRYIEERLNIARREDGGNGVEV